MSNSKWLTQFLVILCSILGVWIAVTVVVDPYFHYHKPIEYLSYQLNYERYINDGIARHFEYNAVVTGTSMTQNFKTSEVDELFGVNSIKTSFAGAGYSELSNHIERVLSYNEDVELVIMGIDTGELLKDANWQLYEEYPEYLYDSYWWNDAPYVLSKEVMYQGILNTLIRTVQGVPNTTFDEYSTFERPAGYDNVLSSSDVEPMDARPISWDANEEELQQVRNTIEVNIIPLIEQYPDVQFILFFPPYSMIYWNAYSEGGDIKTQIQAIEYATELLVPYHNVSLYSFMDQYELVTNLDYYSDSIHYTPDINSQILEWMVDGEGLLTEENYESFFTQVKETYISYDYPSLYQVDN